MLLGQAIEAGEVGRLPKDATLGTIAVDAPHLPWLQAEAEQLGAVGSIGVEGEEFVGYAIHLII